MASKSTALRTKRLRNPATVTLAIGRCGPRQGVENVAALRPGVFALACRVLPNIEIRLHDRNCEQREQPDDKERPLHGTADFRVADFELGLLFAGHVVWDAQSLVYDGDNGHQNLK